MQHVSPSTKMVIISAHALQDLLENTVKQVFQRISLAYFSFFLSFPIIGPCLITSHAFYMTSAIVHLILLNVISPVLS